MRAITLAAVLATYAPVYAANIITLPDATFNEFVSIGSFPEGQAQGSSLLLPESVFADYEDSGKLPDDTLYSRSAQGQALTTGGNVPAADVQGSSQVSAVYAEPSSGIGNEIPVDVTASIQYAISIQPKSGATLPSGQFFFDVPVTIRAIGSVSWSGTNLNEEWVNGIASSVVSVRGQKAQAITGYGGICANTNGCIQNASGDDFDFVFREVITWNASTSFAGSVPISLSAFVDFKPSMISLLNPGNRIDSNSVSAQAIADPILGFENPGDAELFEFIVSPGIAVVPVPATAWLFVSALGLLGWIKRQNT